MNVIGLTGGIATGKSVVASLLREMGAVIVDADQLAREIVRPGQKAWQEILTTFGPDILKDDQTINREKLREIVFKDPIARKRLETITHPRIRELAQERISAAAAKQTEVVVYMAPLLFENKVHLWIRPVVLVTCDLDVQKQRLKERDKLNDSEIERHLSAQMPMKEKKELADLVIENNGDLEELKRTVQAVWRDIKSISLVPDTSPQKGPHGPGHLPG